MYYMCVSAIGSIVLLVYLGGDLVGASIRRSYSWIVEATEVDLALFALFLPSPGGRRTRRPGDALPFEDDGGPQGCRSVQRLLVPCRRPWRSRTSRTQSQHRRRRRSSVFGNSLTFWTMNGSVGSDTRLEAPSTDPEVISLVTYLDIFKQAPLE